MNIEQLKLGQKLQKEIKDLNQTQKELIENFKKYSNGGTYGEGLSISFQPRESRCVVSMVTSKELKQAVFDTINNYIMREINKKETEFLNL